MIVVADTSPLNYLVLIDEIEILPKLYGTVVIPEAVREELLDDDAPMMVRAWISASPKWLRVEKLESAHDFLLEALDRGERDAILLAESIGAERILLDDLQGRREAANRNLVVIGTLGVLVEASRHNLLDLKQAIAALQATNFHVAPALIRMLLENEVG